MKRFFEKFGSKIAVYLLLLVTLCTLPELAAAQYKWVLNGITTLRAGVSYFSSDVLKEASRNSNHYVKGWDGKNPLKIPFTIRNYENTLLYNPLGQELKFRIKFTYETWRLNESGVLQQDTDQNTMCSAQLLNGDGTPANGDTFSITSTEAVPAQDLLFIVAVTPPKDHPLKPGEKVVVEVIAERLTDTDNHEFAGSLRSIFQYEVTDGSSYVQQFELSCESANSRRFIAKLGTGDVPNASGVAQNIVIWWDTGTIGTTTVGNYVFNDILSSQRNQTDETLKDYRKNYCTRTVNGVTHSYSMLRLRNIGSGGNREIAFEWEGYLRGYGDLQRLLAELAQNNTPEATDRIVAPLMDPQQNNPLRDNDVSTYLPDDYVASGAVIGYYIEGIPSDS